ncbi:hypothetical protein KIW84_045004 [Lathyrus oleraceus]|uniref:Enoyl reductase (ER) domain-containing protein n=1 Tax=Pisum sativum TaxID=3888 RepID=A0A9D5AWM1_PEA|nr:hypothetical protein KIW84_045004 [Pisum sativum]
MKMQKAWFYEEYGPKEVLKLGDLPIPSPLHNQLLVQVHAVALNPIDSKRRLRPIFPSEFPVVPGCDMARMVIGKGVNVKKFDSIVVEENLVAKNTKCLSFEEAASLPLAVQTAIEGFKTGDFKKGETMFVVGGAGGVGTLVLQLAKLLFGASYVVSSCSTPKVKFVKQFGADKVVDYTKTKYEDIDEKFDFLYDTVGDCKKSIVIAKNDGAIIDITWPLSHSRAVYSSLTVSGEMLEKLRPYLERGELKPVIDPRGEYSFENVIEAFGYIETGRARGKVVVSCFPLEDILQYQSTILSGY